MSSLIDPFDLPSIKAVFQDSPSLRRTFAKAKINNIVPLMFMPEGSLQGKVAGIGLHAEKHITAQLRRVGHQFERRSFNDKFVDFATDRFGCIEDTPLSALQVAIVRSGDINYPQLAPLDLVTFFERYAPVSTIFHLVEMGLEGLEVIIEHDPTSAEIQREAPIRNLADDLTHLDARLMHLGLSLRIDDPVLANVGLRAVM